MRTISEIVGYAEELAQKGDIAQALEVFLDAIDAYQMQNSEMADEMAFQMGWFLFNQHFYRESIETWKKLQEKGYRKAEIAEIVEKAFVVPNIGEFESIYEKNLEKYKGQIYTDTIYSYRELPYYFLPIENGIYYLYNKGRRQIGEKITACMESYSDDDIFSGENAFDSTVFWKAWDYGEPLKVKQKNNRQMVCFLSDTAIPFSYIQLSEFEELFQDAWYIFGDIEKMKEFFHMHKELSLPRLYKGIREDAEVFCEWINAEHGFRCSKEGRTDQEILLTIGIPSYNRGHRALENIKHLQKLSYDSEVEFLVCDNCSQENVEGYQEIKELAESDSRITYYRFPDNPGGNISFAEAVKRSSGKFCCMLSDEDLIYLDNVWKYLYLIQKYGAELGFIKAAGRGFYHDNENKFFEKGEPAFWEVLWSLNYLSGCIFGVDAHQRLKLHELYEWPSESEDGNSFAKSYPHNIAAMRCALEENIYTCGEMLFLEGKDESESSFVDSTEKRMLDFAKVGQRLKQMNGIVAFLNEWKDMISPKLMKNSYMRIVSKVFMLVDLIRRQGRIVECSFQDAFDQILRASIERICTLETDVEDGEYAYMIVSFSKWYMEYYRNCIEEE